MDCGRHFSMRVRFGKCRDDKWNHSAALGHTGSQREPLGVLLLSSVCVFWSQLSPLLCDCVCAALALMGSWSQG